MAILRAGIFHHWQLKIISRVYDAYFTNINKGPDQCYLSPGKVTDWLHQFDPALIEKTEEKGFNGIIQVMSQGNLTAAHLFGCNMQGAIAHLATERAGIGFLAVFKDDGSDFSVYL